MIRKLHPEGNRLQDEVYYLLPCEQRFVPTPREAAYAFCAGDAWDTVDDLSEFWHLMKRVLPALLAPYNVQTVVHCWYHESRELTRCKKMRQPLDKMPFCQSFALNYATIVRNRPDYQSTIRLEYSSAETRLTVCSKGADHTLLSSYCDAEIADTLQNSYTSEIAITATTLPPDCPDAEHTGGASLSLFIVKPHPILYLTCDTDNLAKSIAPLLQDICQENGKHFVCKAAHGAG